MSPCLLLITLAVSISMSPQISAVDWWKQSAAADSLASNRRIDSALVVGRLALDAARLSAEQDDSAIAILTFKLGKYYYDVKKLPQADSLFVDAIDLLHKCCGDRHPTLAQAIYCRGGVAFLYNRLERADSLFQQSLAIREEIFGKVHVEVARNLIGMASAAYLRQMNDSSASLANRAIAIFTSTGHANEADATKPHFVLADVRFKQGKYQEALDGYNNVYRQREKLLGLMHPEVGVCLYRIGRCYYNLGDYRKAESSYLLGLRISEAVYGLDSYDVGVGLADLAIVDFARKNLRRTESRLKEAVEILKRARGAEHPSVLTTYQLLAQFYAQVGRFNEADSSMRAIIETVRRLPENAQSQLVELLLVRADILVSMSKFSDASIVLQELRDNILSTLGQFHLRYVQMQQVVARNLLKQGFFDSSLSVIRNANKIAQRILPAEHSSVSALRELASKCLRAKKDYQGALRESSFAFEQRRNTFSVQVATLPESEAFAFVVAGKVALNELLSTLSDCDECRQRADTSVIDAILRYHHVASDVIYTRKRLMLQDTAGPGRTLDTRRMELRRQVNALVSQRKWLVDSVLLEHQLDSLNEMTQNVEEEIAKTYEFKNTNSAWSNFSLATVLNALPRATALVEYVRFEYVDAVHDSSCAKYLASVILSNSKRWVVNLGRADEIDFAIHRLQTHMDSIATRGSQPTSADSDIFKTIGGDLRRRIWDPLQIVAGLAKNIYVVPDGQISLISVGSLPDDSEGYLIERFCISYLSSARELVSPVDTENAGFGALVVGDPDFDLRTSDQSIESSQALSTDSTVGLVSHPASQEHSDSNSFSQHFDRLPGTRDEIDIVTKLLTQSFGETVAVLSDSNATELRLRGTISGRRLVHIATHGYIEPEVLEPEHSKGIMSQAIVDNPMSFCGLALAGANDFATNATMSGDKDGRLTADEIAQLDMRGVRCVVLSACESGLGGITSGEGVFGLRRAFTLAGAKSVVTSLWKVSDARTSDLMKQIYSNLDTPMPEVIQSACITRLKSLRRMGQLDHPYSWGAFVFSGKPVALR